MLQNARVIAFTVSELLRKKQQGEGGGELTPSRLGLNGQGLPDKTADLGDEYGKIPSVTIGDSAFLRFSWLLKKISTVTLMINRKDITI